VGDHDVILLDEPTNHLDIEGIAWLAGHLKTRWAGNSGGLIVVTHDRWFLDEVSTNTWEVHDRIIEPFEGGYAAYILQRVERDRMAAASESKRQNLMRKELAWLRRGAPARSTTPKFRMDAAYELIENEPPPRDTVSLSQMAMSRLGKDVVDLLDVSVEFSVIDPSHASGASTKTVLRDVEWRIAPGERTGILGVNGAGKSTLLNLVAGTLQPTSGRVKRGKTVKVATLTQQLVELEGIQNERVSAVIADKRTTYLAGGKEMTPGQLLERLGFTSAQLSTPVKDLSGGQKRRLQLLLILLDEPNVLILDEPTNDLDTDMLAAIEDLLDSWPGTLLVVSHDRYLLERVTDNQYAVMDAAFRHLPGGVEQYLQLRAAGSGGGGSADGAKSVPAQGGQGAGAHATGASAKPALAGAQLRNAEKEIAAIDRKLVKLADQIARVHERLAQHDQSDYDGLGVLTDELRALESQVAELETRWLELSELLGG
jgi:ATPase subunit of ABC transporter with duplicated ATPase domains